jgi:hypothetical protein
MGGIGGFGFSIIAVVALECWRLARVRRGLNFNELGGHHAVCHKMTTFVRLATVWKRTRRLGIGTFSADDMETCEPLCGMIV